MSEEVTEVLSKKLMLLGGEPTHYCPGCDDLHRFNVSAPNKRTGARWTWDGNAEAPTFVPSMNIGSGWCHYFLRAGRLQFQGDCRHALKGQTIDLPDIPAYYLGTGQ